jgi:anti-sigma B factor antagonist
MEVNIRERNGVTIFDIQGRIIGADSLELKSIIDDHIASKTEGEVKILLNLARVPMMDSSGLGVVVAAYTSVQRKKGRIALLNLGRSTRQLIVMAKLMTIFETYDDEDTAVDSFM